MEKGVKIVVFIVVALVLTVVAIAMKEAGAGAVLSIAGVAIYILYQVMFKKNSSAKQPDSNDITLKK
jgi:hypothetical protein